MATAARPRILVADRPSEEELLAAVLEADALLVRSATRVTAPVLEAGRRLRVMGRAGVGVDDIDVGDATRPGVVIVNAPGATSSPRPSTRSACCWPWPAGSHRPMLPFGGESGTEHGSWAPT